MSIKKHQVSLNINGLDYDVEVAASDTVNKVLREQVGLTGTKRGCDYGGCGSCTVIIDGKSCYSCMYPAMRAAGKKILTIEGLEREGFLDPVQEAFVAKGGFQCGYCTPGFIMSTKALLSENPNPSEAEVKDALVGNICRCTGYTKIFESIQYAIELQNEVAKGVPRRATASRPQIKIDFGIP